LYQASELSKVNVMSLPAALVVAVLGLGSPAAKEEGGKVKDIATSAKTIQREI
jgi:hypothetical protein